MIGELMRVTHGENKKAERPKSLRPLLIGKILRDLFFSLFSTWRFFLKSRGNPGPLLILL